MALVEVYGGQKSLAFELNTALLWIEILKCVRQVPGQIWTKMWNSHLFVVNFYSWAEFVCIGFELVVAECFQKEKKTGSISIS